MFCWQVNRNPVRLYWRVRVLNVCSGHVLSLALTWPREALLTLHDRASMVIIKCVVMLFFLVLFYFFSFLESKGHVFELPRLVQICRYIFLLIGTLFTFGFCLFVLISSSNEDHQLSYVRLSANGLKIWFEWVALVFLLFLPGRK